MTPDVHRRTRIERVAVLDARACRLRDLGDELVCVSAEERGIEESAVQLKQRLQIGRNVFKDETARAYPEAVDVRMVQGTQDRKLVECQEFEIQSDFALYSQC
jgi:hypothetical protein